MQENSNINSDLITNEMIMKRARIITIIGLAINLSLATAKITISILNDSLSLLADGFDSALDIATTILGFVAIRIANKPADEEHHYGHTKIENLFSLGIAMLLVASSGIIGYQAVIKLINKTILNFSVANIVITSISIVLKGFLVWIYNFIGKQIKSPSLIANSKNFRTDVLTSAVVLISVIVAPIEIGTSTLYWIDPAIAIGISILIIITAIGITKESSEVLLDQSPDEETLNKIIELTTDQEGIKSVRNIRARKIGYNILLVDLDIYLDPNLTIYEGHEIVCKVEDVLKKELPIKYIQIHMEPYHEHTKKKNDEKNA
ncbi:MAG: cation transporter [Asgard group archaeon]|nr:cation transporter [Asgard group archaeon]